MNREATENLRLDRRLLHRRGWISKAELEQELAALPDVSAKIAPSEREESETASAATPSGPDPTAPPAFPQPE